MERLDVNSSNIQSIGYDESIIEVEFKNGGIYQYLDVPAELYEELINSPSVGNFLHTRIKSMYTAKKIE